MFTDNSTAEAAYSPGASSSRLLLELVLRLRKLELETGPCIHVIHVPGTRMINQGTDGLSRGDQNTGVMAGEAMLDFVPLAQNSLDRSPELQTWIRSWVGSNKEVGKGASWQAPEFLTANYWPRPHSARGM
jgi:hypothetical protein